MADDTEININIGMNPSAAESGSKRTKAALGDVNKEAKELSAALRSFKSAVDPLFAAQEKYNRVLAEGERLLKAQKISQSEYAAGVRAAKAALDEQTASIQRNSAAGRAAAAEALRVKNEERTAIKQAAEEAKLAAREVAAAKRLAAREATAAVKQALAEEKAAIREAAAAAKREAKELADEVKRQAREKTAAERAASKEQAEAEKAAKAEARAQTRAATAEAVRASKERAAANRLAVVSAREAAEETRRQAVAERAAANAANELRASIDPVFASQQRYNQTMQTATALLMQNKLQQGEWLAIQKQARAQMDVNTRSLGRQNSMYVQLGYQAQDVTASLASGINPLVILAQQGGQTAAALSTMGGTIGKVAAFMAGPWGAAIIGFTLLMGYLMESNDKVKKSTVDLMDAESRRKATVQELTDAIKEFIKAQRESNTLEEESNRLKNVAVNTRLLTVQRDMGKAEDQVKSLNKQINDLASNPSEGTAEAIIGLSLELGKAEEKVKLLRKQYQLLQNEAQGELEITRSMNEAEAATDANKRAAQAYGVEIDGLNNRYRQQRAEALKITDAIAQQNRLYAIQQELQKGMVAALNRKKAAEEAASKAKRDANAADREANNGNMTSFGNPLSSMTVTSPYGQRNGKMHQGVDLRAPVGTPIYAPAAGVVRRADGADSNGYGNLITINFGGGTEGRFGHVSKFAVKKGQTVNAGDLIGYTGGAKGAPGSGDSQAPHLHYEVRRQGKSVDPLKGKYPADAGGAGQDNEAFLAREQKARQDALEDKLAALDFERQMNEDSYNEQVKIQEKKIAALTDFFGAEGKETIKGQRELLLMQQRHEKEQIRIKTESIQLNAQLNEARLNDDREAANANISNKGADIDLRRSAGIISARQEAAERRALIAEQYDDAMKFEEDLYQLKIRSLRDQMALLPLESAERVRINNQILQAETEHELNIRGIKRQTNQQVLDLNRQVAANTIQKYAEIKSTITQSLNSMFQGLWTGNQTFMSSLLSLADAVIFKFVDMGIQLLVNWAATQLGLTGLTTSGQAARSATEAAGVAAHTAAEATKTGITTGAIGVRSGAELAAMTAMTVAGIASRVSQVIGLSGVAGAAAFASTAAIPIVGPAIAPAAAAAAVAATMGFLPLASAARGWGEVPQDGMLTELHKSEMVLPASIASPLRASLAGFGPQVSGFGSASNDNWRGNSTAGAGGGRKQEYHLHLSAIDGESAHSFIMNNHRSIGKAFKKAVRGGMNKDV